jgi:hypothetical protein
MFRIFLILLFFDPDFVIGQDSKRIYGLTIAGLQPGDTLQKAIFYASPYIAEAVDDLGFEVLLRRRFIKRYSITLYSNDSIVFSKTKVAGSRFSEEVLTHVKSDSNLIRLEVFDLSIKQEGKRVRIIKGPIVFFLK